eukprot:g45401.t1
MAASRGAPHGEQEKWNPHIPRPMAAAQTWYSRLWRQHWPVTEIPEPIAERPEPIAEGPEPIAEGPEPIAEGPEPTSETLNNIK